MSTEGPARTAGQARKVILDCDPGHDDALAIILCAGDPRVELVGICTVAGNQALAKTTRNACVMATLLDLKTVPVVAGCDRPLLRELRTAPEIHGTSGLDGPAPVVPVVEPVDAHAVDFIVSSVMAAPGEITLVATGPVTNLAMALRREPAIARAVWEVVVMGGAYGRGNVTPAAEFNVFVDPEAAQVVFEAPWPLTMMGLDLTHQATCSEVTQEALAEGGRPLGRFVDELLGFYRRAYRRQAGMGDPPVHDPCAVAYVIDASMFEVARADVRVETCGRWTSGMTVVDFAAGGGRSSAASGADAASSGSRGDGDGLVGVGTRLDREAFWETMVAAVRRVG